MMFNLDRAGNDGYLLSVTRRPNTSKTSVGAPWTHELVAAWGPEEFTPTKLGEMMLARMVKDRISGPGDLEIEIDP